MNLNRFAQLSVILAGLLLAGGVVGCRSNCCRSADCTCPPEDCYGYASEGFDTPPATGAAESASEYPDFRSSRRQPVYDDDALQERQFPPGKPIVPPRRTTLGRKPSSPELPADDVFEDGQSTTKRHTPFASHRHKMADHRRQLNLFKRNQGDGATPAKLARRNAAGDQNRERKNPSDERLVTLTPPTDGNPSDERRLSPLPLPIGDHHHATKTPASLPFGARDRSRSQELVDLPVDGRASNATLALGSPARSAPSNAWVAAMRSRSVPLNNHLTATSAPEREPVRLTDPPMLHTPPGEGNVEQRFDSEKELAIPRIRICRQVRGFEDVVPLDVDRLRQGQPILIYATLENFHSVSTPKGYRTLTLSTLEVQTADGSLLHRQPLGPAVDLTDVLRREFFLTHLVTIPEDLPPGDYLFNLCVDDLLKHGSAQARIAVHVTEDRNPRDGMADTSESATRPISFRE